VVVKYVGAVAAIAATLSLPAAWAKGSQPVLGIYGNSTGKARLAWFDPSTLTKLPGRQVALTGHTWPWAFSPDRARLVLAGSEDAKQLRFVNARSMRVLGQVPLRYAGGVRSMRWVGSDAVLALVQGNFDATIVVVDAARRRIVRTTKLEDRIAYDVAPFGDGFALLLGKPNGVSTAAVAVVDGEGKARIVDVPGVSVGTNQIGDASQFETRRPGFAVDPAGGRAFVVDADFTVAEVDLDTLKIAYHGRSARSLAKNVNGPSREAHWLGSGMLAVAGVDYSGDERGAPVGLRLIDTHDWSRRLVDPNVAFVDVGDGILVGIGPLLDGPRHYEVYGFDGVARYSVDLERLEWLFVQGPYAYTCSNDGAQRVMDGTSGATLREFSATLPACASLLYGQSSG
jgi:hypothetical protein